MVKPFVRWAGGKTRLLPIITQNMPLLNSTNKYFEPFIGGGSLFFYLERENSYISDTNSDLIAAYRVIQSDLNNLVTILRDYKTKDCEAFFQQVKNMDLSPNYKNLPELERGARFIYLVKTCFNGVFRVNSKGHFNKAYAFMPNPNICDVDTLVGCNKVLSKNIEIHESSYEAIFDKVSDGDFVYLDPPYDPISDTANFTKYTKSGFNKNDQQKLKDFVDELTKKNVNVMISNNYTDFIIDLWKDYKQLKVDIQRNIAGSADARGMANEILIMNYDNQPLFEF